MAIRTKVHAAAEKLFKLHAITNCNNPAYLRTIGAESEGALRSRQAVQTPGYFAFYSFRMMALMLEAPTQQTGKMRKERRGLLCCPSRVELRCGAWWKICAR
jgi:hypothetical protein